MPRVRRSAAAIADLMGIWRYIADDNRNAADDFLRRLSVRLRTLARYSLLGRARPELGPEIRSVPFGSYVVYYIRIPNGIEVIRVLHAARDVDAELGG